MNSEHSNDHKLIAEDIATDAPWAHSRLLVHLAREHGLRVEDVFNKGLTPLIVMHNHAHGGTQIFANAERRSPNDGLRNGLANSRRRHASE